MSAALLETAPLGFIITTWYKENKVVIVFIKSCSRYNDLRVFQYSSNGIAPLKKDLKGFLTPHIVPNIARWVRDQHGDHQ